MTRSVTTLQRLHAVVRRQLSYSRGHENTVYELSGPPRTYEEFARAIGEVLGREVPVQQVDAAEYERMMGGLGLPGHLVELLVDAQRGMAQGAWTWRARVSSSCSAAHRRR